MLLRDARLRAGLSQAELGRRAGVTQSVVSAYESGARQPSVPMLARLVAATGLELDLRVSEPATIRPASGGLGQRIQARRVELQAVLAGYGLRNPRLFGSISRGEEGPESDVDLLVDVLEGVGLVTLGRCQADHLQLAAAAGRRHPYTRGAVASVASTRCRSEKRPTCAIVDSCQRRF